MPCPGRNAPSPPRLTPLRHPHLSHTITTTPSHHQHLPPLVPLPVLILRLRPPRFISFYSAKNIQKSFRMMVHDDLLTRRLPSASRRDATPFLRRPPPPSRYLRGYIPRKRFNPLSPPLSLKWHRTARLLEFLRHSIFFFFFFPSSFLFFFFFHSVIRWFSGRGGDGESSTNARDFRKDYRICRSISSLSPLSFSLQFVFFPFLGPPPPPSPLLPPKNFSSDPLQRFVF